MNAFQDMVDFVAVVVVAMVVMIVVVVALPQGSQRAWYCYDRFSHESSRVNVSEGGTRRFRQTHR